MKFGAVQGKDNLTSDLDKRVDISGRVSRTFTTSNFHIHRITACRCSQGTFYQHDVAQTEEIQQGYQLWRVSTKWIFDLFNYFLVLLISLPHIMITFISILILNYVLYEDFTNRLNVVFVIWLNLRQSFCCNYWKIIIPTLIDEGRLI